MEEDGLSPPHQLLEIEEDMVKISELPQQIEKALDTIANWRKENDEMMDYISHVKSSIAEAFNIVKMHINNQEKMVLNVIDKEYVAAKQKKDRMNEQLTVRLDQLLELQKEVMKNTSLEEEVCLGDAIKVNEVTLSVQKMSSIACTVEEFKRNLIKLVVENFPAQRPNEHFFFSIGATDVTFDLKRINPRLELSEDKRRVIVSRFPPKYEHSAKRFRISQVMGSPGFSEGRHYWQVSTKDAAGWAIGLAHEEIGSTDKLGRTELSWCIEWSDGWLSACHGTQETRISQEKPLQVGVFLDIPRNCVSFYSKMDTETCLHTFEINVENTVYPTFWIFGVDVGGSLTINEIKKC
ncbi:hypothetical protein JD844_011170 [Phrynosoma platyrhinos]|uniref:B30.2/SPRY domain-containing protein n=1 Tax=Phrynosoma platyrhinos TaxID=52577 RepID=A0ABQ7THX1_PHRPL|nr:hypothetical protein JD844_011170 [Phrynosoma platyrhinos]